MNRVFIIGNITGDIYFDQMTIKGAQRPFLRLLLMANQPCHVQGLRVVLWDDNALRYYPFLLRGSQIAVIGSIQSRKFHNKLVHEIEAEHLILLRNINWQDTGGKSSTSINGSGSHAFVVGTVKENFQFEWRPRKSTGDQYARLQLCLDGDKKKYHDLSTVLLGSLAELVHPYLQAGSKIAVDGHVQTMGGKQQITAHHVTFLENIDWKAGTQARLQRGSDFYD